MKIPQFVKKLTGGVTLACFIAGSCPQPLLAATSGPDANFQPLIVSKLELPQETGTVEEFFQGNKPFHVVLIRDAHAIPEAQRNIQTLIELFQKNYGIRRVGVEGATGQMDAQILRSFPQKEKLREILNVYLERGEWTGVNGSAVFSGENMVYEGLEDWELYEQGLEGYRAALNQQPGLLSELAVQKEKLQQDKQRFYSPALLKIDTALERFEAERAELSQALLVLSAVKKPSSPDLLAMLEGIKEESVEAGEAIAGELNELALGIKKKDLLGAEEKAVFNAKFQAYTTGEINAPEFSHYLQSFEPLPANLKILADRHRRLQNLEGTRVMKDFEAFAQSVKESLFANDAERDLDRKGKEIRLFERFARLELNWEDWESIKKQKFQKNVWEKYTGFYKNAQAREKLMGEKLLKLVAKENVLVVAGGFHTAGLTAELKDKSIPYVVVRPNIQTLPEKQFYQDQMRGNVSWNRYFRPDNGKVNLYQAFIQALRDDLLQGGASSDRAFTLKAWKDQLIRDLASKGKQGEISKYMSLLHRDEGGSAGIENALRRQWTQNIEKFIEKFQLLQAQGQLTADSILKIIEPSTIPSIIAPVLFPRSEIRESLLARTISDISIPESNRSEVRSTDGDSILEKEIAETGEAIDRYLNYPLIAEEASKIQIINRIDAFDEILLSDRVNPEKRIDLGMFIALSLRKVLNSQNLGDLDTRVIGRILFSFQHAINILGNFLNLNLPEGSKKKVLLHLSVIMENIDEIFKSLQETLEAQPVDVTEADRAKMPIARSFGRVAIAMIEIFVRSVEWLGKQPELKKNLAWAYFFAEPAELASDFLAAAKNSQYVSGEIKHAINERFIPSLQILLSGSEYGNDPKNLNAAIQKLNEMANGLKQEDEDFTLQRTRKILSVIEKLRSNYPKLTRSEVRELGSEWLEQLAPIVKVLTAGNAKNAKRMEAFERLNLIAQRAQPVLPILGERGNVFKDEEVENVAALMSSLLTGFSAAAFHPRIFKKYSRDIDNGLNMSARFFFSLQNYLKKRNGAFDRMEILQNMVDMSNWVDKVLVQYRTMLVRTRKVVDGSIKEDPREMENRILFLGLVAPLQKQADAVMKSYFEVLSLVSEPSEDQDGQAFKSTLLEALSDMSTAFMKSVDFFVQIQDLERVDENIRQEAKTSLAWLASTLDGLHDTTAYNFLRDLAASKSGDTEHRAQEILDAISSVEEETKKNRSEVRQVEQWLMTVAGALRPAEVSLPDVSRSELREASQGLADLRMPTDELRVALMAGMERGMASAGIPQPQKVLDRNIARTLAIQSIEANLLKTLSPENLPESPFAFGTVLPGKNSREFAGLFVKAVRPGAVVMVEGKLPGGFDKEIRNRGGQIRPESMNRAVELPGNQPDAAIVLEDGFAGIFHEMFRPFYLDPKNLDPDAQHLGITLLSVAAAHYGMLVSKDPELRLKPEALKQELLNRLQRFEEFPDLFAILSSGKTWGLGLVSEKLEEFISQRAAQVSA